MRLAGLYTHSYDSLSQRPHRGFPLSHLTLASLHGSQVWRSFFGFLARASASATVIVLLFMLLPLLLPLLLPPLLMAALSDSVCWLWCSMARQSDGQCCHKCGCKRGVS